MGVYGSEGFAITDQEVGLPPHLEVTEEDETEVVTGSLICDACSERYPIVDTIPNLLPPDLRG